MGDAYCTECKRNTEVVFDHSAGDTVCSECGLVLESHSIDETSEWRTFANEARDNDPNRVGGPSNPLLNEGSLTTVISKANGASGGIPLYCYRCQSFRIVLTEASPDVDEKTISEDEIVYPKGREASKISREYIEHPQLSPVRDEQVHIARRSFPSAYEYDDFMPEKGVDSTWKKTIQHESFGYSKGCYSQDTCKIPEGISSQIFGGIIAFMEQESRLDLQNKLNECKINLDSCNKSLQELQELYRKISRVGKSAIVTPVSALSHRQSALFKITTHFRPEPFEILRALNFRLLADWVLETGFVPGTDNVGGGSNGDGKFPSGGGGGRGEDDDDDDEENEFEPLLKFEEVMKMIGARGASLPYDMLEAAKTVGIREVLLLRYLDSQVKIKNDSGSAYTTINIIQLLLSCSALRLTYCFHHMIYVLVFGLQVPILGFLVKSSLWLRNRLLAYPSFLYKIGIEIVIDTCCATFAEVQKRGKKFWTEFELYVADMLVGVVVNVALVGLLAPYVRIGQPSLSKGLLGRMQHAYNALPSSVFEAKRPGCRFSVQQRIGTYFYKGILYASVGFTCGLIGQGIANMIMTAKRYSFILYLISKS
ncbi:hypothetical protein GIB67_017776 [Kingdonia uniflora]|uniref:TFIIB-type domain-containing protein n=1 Tax=Kingdonia uniflora TaxID=39325 RepID=A0A7J7MPC5_9MAGN|nr:hypothetical protein GIB67_017776 [Kingdonia uniflora]